MIDDPRVSSVAHGFRSRLPCDPIAMLLESGNPEVVLGVRRDLLGQDVAEQWAALADLPERIALLRASDESGALSSVDSFAGTVAALLRVADLGGAMSDPRVDAACRWLLRHVGQSDEVARREDLRWFARAARALVRLGHEDDPVVEDLYRWFAATIRPDGGWLPSWVVRDQFGPGGEAAVSDPTLPSHIATTCAVARAFGASPRRREWPVVRQVGEAILNCVGRDGRYPNEEAEAWGRHDDSREHPSRYGVLSAIAELPFNAEDPRVAEVMRWVLEHQDENGRWERNDLLTLDVLIALKRLHEASRACG